MHAAGITGSRTLQRLENHFPVLADALNAPHRALVAAGVREQAAAAFIERRAEVDAATIQNNCARHGITTLSWHDAAYPHLLKELPDPPALLFVRGNLQALTRLPIAMVGARKTTPYGERAAATLARELCDANASIVSGLALGIDACAHRAALEAGGHTVAVLGSGCDDASVYPRANYPLARAILAANGALVSEHLPGTPALPYHFPQRNRIVAGLCRATVVVEAGATSGALITAHLALDYNREVLAVPGSIFSLASGGTNKLLRLGAAPATSAQDILEAVGADASAQPRLAIPATPLNPAEEEIMRHLGSEPQHVNTLARLTKLDTAGLNATLSVMEIKGIVRHAGGGRYLRL